MAFHREGITLHGFYRGLWSPKFNSQNNRNSLWLWGGLMAKQSKNTHTHASFFKHRIAKVSKIAKTQLRETCAYVHVEAYKVPNI